MSEKDGFEEEPEEEEGEDNLDELLLSLERLGYGFREQYLAYQVELEQNTTNIPRWVTIYGENGQIIDIVPVNNNIPDDMNVSDIGDTGSLEDVVEDTQGDVLLVEEDYVHINHYEGSF